MSEYPYSSSFSYPQPQNGQRRPPQQQQPTPSTYRSAYAQPAQRAYDPMQHMQYTHTQQQYGQPPPPPGPPPPQGPPPGAAYGSHATYSNQYYNDPREMHAATDMRDLRDIRDIDFPSSYATTAAPPPQQQGPPQVPTSDGYAPLPVVAAAAMMAAPQAPPNMFWGPPADNGQPPRPSSHDPPPTRPGAQQARPIAQADFNSPQSHPSFNEDSARTTATATFDRFDQDRGNYLDLQEFMDALRALHLSITYHGALECFARADHNCDGRITKEEFINVYIEEMRKPARY